jgi:hypothetical protein
LSSIPPEPEYSLSRIARAAGAVVVTPVAVGVGVGVSVATPEGLPGLTVDWLEAFFFEHPAPRPREIANNVESRRGFSGRGIIHPLPAEPLIRETRERSGRSR